MREGEGEEGGPGNYRDLWAEVARYYEMHGYED